MNDTMDQSWYSDQRPRSKDPPTIDVHEDGVLILSMTAILSLEKVENLEIYAKERVNGKCPKMTDEDLRNWQLGKYATVEDEVDEQDGSNEEDGTEGKDEEDGSDEDEDDAERGTEEDGSDEEDDDDSEGEEQKDGYDSRHSEF